MSNMRAFLDQKHFDLFSSRLEECYRAFQQDSVRDTAEYADTSFAKSACAVMPELEGMEPVLEESYRQWNDFLEDAPERADGEGFGRFVYDILREKSNELLAEEDT